MTELLFRDDPYRRSCETAIIRSEGRRNRRVTIGFAGDEA